MDKQRVKICRATHPWPLRLARYAVLLLVITGGYVGAGDPFVANTHQDTAAPDATVSRKLIDSPAHGLSAQKSLMDEKKSPRQPSVANGRASNADSVGESRDVQDVSDSSHLPLENQILAKPRRSTEASESQISKNKTTATGKISMWRSMFSLLVVLALIVGAAYLFRRFMPSANRFSKNSGLEVLARCGIGPKQSICLVKIGPRLVLMGLSPNHMAALDVINDADEVATILGGLETSAPESISSTFGKFFHQEAGEFSDETEELSETQGKDKPVEAQQIHLARRELSGLLEKVKGLGRLKGRF